MIAGVSTACLFPKPLEESLYELAVNGISAVEIFVNSHSDRPFLISGDIYKKSPLLFYRGR